MDNKLNTEDNSDPKNGNPTIRESLVTSETDPNKIKKSKKRSRDVSSNSDDDDGDSDSSYHRKKSKKSKKKKLKKKKSKKVKRKKHNSDSSSDSDDYKKNKQKRKEKKKLKKSIKNDNDLILPKTLDDNVTKDDDSASFGPAVPEDIASKSRAFVPMTKEEWEKQQSRIRRVYDPESGRHRLIRGDGEVVEECVSRDRHRQINKQATAADGLFFQMNVTKK